MIRPFATALLVGVALCLATPAGAADDIVTVTDLDEAFTPEQRAKLLEAVALANRVLASPELRARLGAIRQFTYSRSDGAQVHRDLTGRTYTLRFEAVA
ncbi:MAG: hypothetical protein KIT58_24310, partial [Planctomycetota bacterium]|nr:hypothetical protein [Planctomycetota bacterium]